MLAGAAILLHVRRQDWLRSLDRHFFREQYNAQDVLRSALESVRNAANLIDVAPMLVKQIGAALHPTFCAIMQHRPFAPAYTPLSIFPDRFPAPALLNSSLFYWFWRMHSDGFHCGYGDVYRMTFNPISSPPLLKRMEKCVRELMQSLNEISQLKEIQTKTRRIKYQEFYPGLSKRKMDALDECWAEHFGLSQSEVHFILNYDIKYRLGVDDGD